MTSSFSDFKRNRSGRANKSEPTGHVLFSVGLEDDVKFVGLCEARGIAVLRIGVTDISGTLENQEIANWRLGGLASASAHKGTLAELFG